MEDNFILKTDAYKQTHWLQYPPGTETIYSYLESRGGKFDSTVFFGLQMILKKHFVGQVVTQEMVDEASEFCGKVFGTTKYFNRQGWEYIVKELGGRIPIRIKAIPEGTVVPVQNVLMTVENTHPKVPFVTNFCETLLMQTWYPTTVCTNSFKTKQLIDYYCKLSGGEVSPFHLNDFGFRGVSSFESAGIGGCAHLVNFAGTDTLEGIRHAMKYYNSDVCGYSVAAAEHSTVTIYKKENESEAYERFIDVFPTGILSIVCDSYDTINAVDNIFGKELKDKILSRDGRLVARPDSGNPVEIVVQVLDALWKCFGGTINSKGFKVLNPCVGVIYGDGINYDSIYLILEAIISANYSVENVVFGEGGALLQQVDRDTFQFAFKCSAAKVYGAWRDVYKQPVTMSSKRSKPGRHKLIKNNGTYVTVSYVEFYNDDDKLQTVFENGELLIDHKFEDIKKRTELFL